MSKQSKRPKQSKRSKQRSAKAAAPREDGQARLTSLAKKPVTWVVGVILVALGATFSSGLQSMFAGLMPDGWSEPGSGIKVVDVRRKPLSGPVLIPQAESAKFSDQADAREKVNDPEWEAQHEWYAAGRITWEVTIVGRHSDPVVITDLRPERTGPCTERLEDGVLVDDVPQGESKKIALKTAIDAKVPQLTSVADGSAYFDDGTITLAKGETVVISIQATSAGPTCEWVLEADYVDHGERESMTIEGPGDRPFAITGFIEDRGYDLTWGFGCNDRAVSAEEATSGDLPPKC
ncbi:hypothetical protein [Nocardioides sp.]|uniref:hypothetical protein n=1 Tax=Nocardioides sp. TaxID=35761 RepID=UPI0019C74A5F|nr:hypothetical protein [Nocardioides sp.]MBC7275091.1 hypothetical protein [Nocardioides sp.]